MRSPHIYGCLRIVPRAELHDMEIRKTGEIRNPSPDTYRTLREHERDEVVVVDVKLKCVTI